MKLLDYLSDATRLLTDAGIITARLDALVLIGDVIGKDRAHLLAHPEIELTHEQQIQLQKLLDGRATHEPLAYIRGKTEFYGREFVVNNDVLEPRPESEDIIELLKQQSADTIIDVGTGSGALAITAKLELPQAQVLALDIDQNCLTVTRQNARKHGVDIKFLQGNLLEPVFDHPMQHPVAILANLPYVPDDYAINTAATHEPKLALFGGQDGLNLYRTMFQQLNEYFPTGTLVFTESLPNQHTELMNIALTQNYTQVDHRGFIQVFSKT